MRVAYSIAMIAIVTLGCAKAPERSTTFQQTTGTQKVLSCTIHSAPIWELGAAPQVRVAITNETDASIYLVGSLDKSSRRSRYPHCYFEVVGPDSKSSLRAGASVCGLSNALRHEDFVNVPPKASFDPFQRIDDYGFFGADQLVARNFSSVGEYRIRFVYSTESDAICEWLGHSDDEKVTAMFKGVPKGITRSNEITVTIVAPRNQQAAGPAK